MGVPRIVSCLIFMATLPNQSFNLSSPETWDSFPSVVGFVQRFDRDAPLERERPSCRELTIGLTWWVQSPVGAQGFSEHGFSPLGEPQGRCLLFLVAIMFASIYV